MRTEEEVRRAVALIDRYMKLGGDNGLPDDLVKTLAGVYLALDWVAEGAGGLVKANPLPRWLDEVTDSLDQYDRRAAATAPAEPGGST